MISYSDEYRIGPFYWGKAVVRTFYTVLGVCLLIGELGEVI